MNNGKKVYNVVPVNVGIYSTSDESLTFPRIVQESNFQRSYPIFSQIEALQQSAFFPRVEVQWTTIHFFVREIVRFVPILERFGGSPFTCHHYIEMRLVPKIISKFCHFSFGPRSWNLQNEHTETCFATNLPLTVKVSPSISMKSPFPLPSGSPRVEIIISPDGKQWVVWGLAQLKACISDASIT